MTIPSKIIKYPSVAKGGDKRMSIDFLEKAKVKYELIEHRTVYTAYDKAATLRVPQKTVGKTLVVKIDRDFALVLIPANKNLDKAKLKKIARVKRVDFATEAWMKRRLTGVKVGAVPPFGGFFGLPTFVDRGLLQELKIILNGGDYNCSIKISPGVFKKLIPDLVIGNFSKVRR